MVVQFCPTAVQARAFSLDSYAGYSVGMHRLLLLMIAFSSCEVVSRPDSGTEDAGAADGGFADAGHDAGVTWNGAIQPLLLTKCAPCHDRDAGVPAFAASYAVMIEPSRLCSPERVGVCVSWALQGQAPEGPGCRTYNVTPFHREGWTCLTPAEIDLVVGWVDAGMVEQ